MTPSFVPETFERVMGCTETELVSWLPRALPEAELSVDAPAGHSVATWAGGSLELRWNTLPPRRIALLEIPQLKVHFVYRDLNDEQRYRLQKCFDLQTHRGGG
ncbi:MAG: hypothetical protein MUF55_00220 [Hydrogenophaga sp.]|jgi:hypothetical protein|nr:hypothetical protein [Hydrogenophaga sp.]